FESCQHASTPNISILFLLAQKIIARSTLIAINGYYGTIMLYYSVRAKIKKSTRRISLLLVLVHQLDC
ncbi:MAG: hypothetical protein V2I33_25965, partial [Kangiellaceae bacterium]|nr:hypothetical protein [Kangiellaceae bacterium]